MDGESDNVYGCMMALLWSDTNNGSVKVDVFGMFNAKHFISYTIAGARAPTGVAMHLQYTVVAVDASPTHAWATAPAASVYLFSAMVSSGPIAVLPTHTNNAHSVDLVVMPFALPPLLKEEQSGVVDQLFVSVVDEGTAELLYMTVPSPYTAA